MLRTRTLAAGVVILTSALTALAGTAVLTPADAASHHTSSDRAGVFTVTAKVNKTEPLLDELVTIKGSVKPAAPGAEVRLQVKYENRKSWKTIGTDTLNASSNYKPRSRGTFPAPSVTADEWRRYAGEVPLPIGLCPTAE